MTDPHMISKPFPLKAGAVIILIVAALAGCFGYAAGWLSPQRLTPEKMVKALTPPGGPALGHRRNHIKGVCFTGVFDANGAGSALSTAQLFTRGQYRVVGRFNTGGSDPKSPDAMAQVRGFSTRIIGPGGQERRSAMIDAPFFAVSTPQDFFAFLTAAGDKDPNAIKTYIGAHPEILPFISWAKTHPRSESWAEDRFNSINSFTFIDASGGKHNVRWSFVPAAPTTVLSAEDLSSRDPDFLAQEITQRVAAAPQRWDLIITVADPADPTADPTKAWPVDRRTVNAGTLTVQKTQAEADGACRDINYDPTVLPSGMTTSDDPFPAARSAAYRVSYDKRTAESAHYPRTATEEKP